MLLIVNAWAYLLSPSASTEERRLASEAIAWLRDKRDEPFAIPVDGYEGIAVLPLNPATISAGCAGGRNDETFYCDL